MSESAIECEKHQSKFTIIVLGLRMLKGCETFAPRTRADAVLFMRTTSTIKSTSTTRNNTKTVHDDCSPTIDSAIHSSKSPTAISVRLADLLLLKEVAKGIDAASTAAQLQPS